MKRSMQKTIPWLPIDSRFFSFGHVRGVSRIFLTLEMIFAVLIVLGTLILTITTYHLH